MMMTDKYCTLPSVCYSTIYDSPTANRIRDIKKKISTLDENKMKLLIEQPTIKTYSLYDIQERIDYFEKKKLFDTKEKVHSNPSSSSSAETLQSVIANTLQQTYFNNESYGSALSRTMMNSSINTGYVFGKRRSLSTSHLATLNDQKRSNRYCSSLAKRARTYSLSNYSTMAISAATSFSEEQTTSMDYENTYFYPEETTRFDDALSLTTITSNVQTKTNNTQHDVSDCSDTTVFQSDTDENSEAMIKSAVKQHGDTYDIIMSTDLQNENIKTNDEHIIRIRLSLTPPDHDFTGVVHATKYTVVKEREDDVQQCLSDYDNVNHYTEQDNKIRSIADNIPLNKSMTSSMQRRRILTDEQLNQQEKRTNENDDDGYIKVNQHTVVQSTRMKNDIEMVTQHEHDVDDEHYSDVSHSSDELRYSSDAARHSCTSDDLNNTSSTLRQEAISITRVRCKRRKTWIRSPTHSPNNNNHPKASNYLQQRRLTEPFLPNDQVDGTDDRQNAIVNSPIITKTGTYTTVLNHTPVRTATGSMLLHKNSLDYNNNPSKHDKIPLNTDDHSIKNDESSSTTHAKDASSPTSKKTNEFYQSYLSPVKRLLNESIDSNIEIIQMDEQECILEIVDGVLTIVPKEKSTSSSSIASDAAGKIVKKKHRKHYDSSQHQQRSSSIASSISTPSLSEHEQEREELSSTSSSRLSTKPFVILQNVSPSKPTALQTEESLDLFDIPIKTNKKTQQNVLNDSLSSVSSYGDRSSATTKKRSSVPRSSSPITNQQKSSSIKDNLPSSIENQTRSNKSTVLSELLQTVNKSSPNEETKIESDIPIPISERPPTAKPINKARINEFASLLSSSVHLSQPQPIKKQITPTPSKTISTIVRPSPSSPAHSDDRSFSSIPSAHSDRDERESYHTVKSNNSEQDQIKKHIDARYTEKLDDRGSIKINTANIKALFEQKISDTNKALSQSTEHLAHLTEVKQQHQHKKVPVSYGSLKRNYQQTTPTNNIRKSNPDTLTMNKYTDHMAGAKDVLIEDKQPENGHRIKTRHNSSEQTVRSTVDSLSNSPVSSTNGHHSESLIAREIRETKEKEDELKRQRKKCGLTEDVAGLISVSTNDSIKSESTIRSVKKNSFLSNLDFFTSKANGASNESSPIISSPRRSIVPTPNLVYDSQGSSSSSSDRSRQSSNDELKQMNNVVSQELNRFNENGIPIIRTGSTNGSMQRSSSNQNILSTQNTNNIIQREIEAIRAKEAELRQLGRIQHTSDEHSDPRKYQELVSTLPKSQSINTLSSGKIRRDSENQHISRHNGPMTATTNGFLKSKTNNKNNNSSNSSLRGKLPSPNYTTPIFSSSVKSTDYSKLSSTDRLELEKRQCHERETELRKQRGSISVATSSTNTTINGDSGNVSQEEHEEDQERYFDKIERLKRTENAKAQAPFIRPTKKTNMSTKWEQMMANKSDD